MGFEETMRRARQDMERKIAERQRQQEATQKVAQQGEFESARAEREKDIGMGLERGKQLVPESSLGRVEKGISGAPSQSQQQIAQMRKEQAEKGFGAQAFQAARESRLRNLQRAQERQQRSLAGRQAQLGLRGGAATGQLGSLLGEQARQSLQAEQELMLQDVAQRQQALGAYEQTTAAQDAARRAAEQYNIENIEKYNIDQAAKEKAAQLQMGLTEAQLGLAERAGIRQEDIAKAMQQAQLQAASGSGGKK